MEGEGGTPQYLLTCVAWVTSVWKNFEHCLTVCITGSPCSVSVFDPASVMAFGEGLRKGVKGEEAMFVVQGVQNGEDITASVEGRLPSDWLL